MADLPILKTQRRIAKTSVTKELNKLPGLFSARDFDFLTARASIDKIDKQLESIIEQSEKLVRLLPDAEIEAELEAAQNYYDDNLGQILLYKRRLENLMQPSTPVAPNFMDSSLVAHPSASVKLPKLDLVKFYGDSANWQEFWDSFDASIHSQPNLSDVDKFKYLKANLRGDAHKLVDGYKLTAVNYQAVIDCLKQRYGNPELAIFQHFEDLLALPAASADNKSLQLVYDECERHIRSLVALGLGEETFGRVFTPIILSKLPKYIRLDLHRQNGVSQWSLAKLRELLNVEIQIRQMSSHAFGTSRDQGSPDSRKFKPKFNGAGNQKIYRGTASTLVNAEPKRGSDSEKCVFCGGFHPPDSCKKYGDCDSRRAVVKGRCFLCFGSHQAKACSRHQKCSKCGSAWHHVSLCNKTYNTHNLSTTSNHTFTPQQTNQFPPKVTLESNCISKFTHMQTAMTQIKVHNCKHSTISARLIFDTASSRTYITSALSKRLGCPTISHDTVSIAAFGAKTRYTETCSVVHVNVVCSDRSVQQLEALVVEHICNPAAIFPVDFDVHPELKGLEFAEQLVDKPVLGNIDVLVGGDFYFKFITGMQLCRNDLVILDSRVGHLLAGKASFDHDQDSHCSLVCAMLRVGHSSVSDRNYQLERFWSLEDIGVVDKLNKHDDDVAFDQFESSITFHNGRYAVRWPWKVENPDLPDNFGVAFGRLRSLLRRIKPDEKVFQTYAATIEEQEKLGIIERVANTDSNSLKHYIPHHCVVKPDSVTTKIRIVYDASCKTSKSSQSLNECLHRGPIFLPDLCGLLLRFRKHKIAFAADIEKAFLQIELQDDQRDVTRFLWVADPTKQLSADNLLVFRSCRVLFGVISSPFLLAATIRHHLQRVGTPFSRLIADSTFVDNVLTGQPNSRSAIKFYRDAKNIFNAASMNLREWYTNDSTLCQAIEDRDRGLSSEPKVLGLRWNVKADTLRCPEVSVPLTEDVTKRQMLHFLAKLFDPCGYFAPISVIGKCLIQEVWRRSFDWDTAVPKDLANQWQQFADSLSKIHTFEVPRYLAIDKADKLELHCFCDASGKAYAAAVYLLVHTEHGSACHLVFAKSRVCPLKTLEMPEAVTIPRLELLAVYIGAKILDFVQTEMAITPRRKVIWSDSTSVLHWVIGQQATTRFVQNRVKVIRGYPDVDYRYVPTNSNPADVASRGCTALALFQFPLWWHGPDWLANPDVWPANVEIRKPPVEPIMDLSDTPIVQSEDSSTNLILSGAQNVCEGPHISHPLTLPSINHVIDATRFSRLDRLLRVTAWVFRFVRASQPRDKIQFPTVWLTSLELRKARFLWILYIQRAEYPDLVYGKNSVKTRTFMHNLNCYLDSEGLIRCRGRLKHSSLPDEAKDPILLPKRQYFTRLVVSECHTLSMHVGVSQTLAELRLRYWIPHGRELVKSVLGKCTVCRKAFGGHFPLPPPPPLPGCRVTKQPPFTCTGLDYLGPLHIRDDTGTCKVWLCLFTCAVIRAVHIEVVDDLSAKQFLLCLRRFIALYGCPKLIISDNASQFHASHRALVHLLENCTEIADYSASREISWKFIPEMAPWMGGFYERLVGTFKRCLKVALPNRLVTLIELQTVAMEACAVVNSRPLTYVSSDEDNVPISPANFLAKGISGGLPMFNVTPLADEFNPQRSTAKSLAEAWRSTQVILNNFWDRWLKEYLLSLRERMQRMTKNSKFTPQVNSVVLIKDNLPRGQWKMARIESLIQSADGLIRSAVVVLSTRKRLTRPLKLLFPVEVSDLQDLPDIYTPEDSTQPPLESTQTSQLPDGAISLHSRRPKRIAATEAERRVKAIADAELSDASVSE